MQIIVNALYAQTGLDISFVHFLQLARDKALQGSRASPQASTTPKKSTREYKLISI